MTHISSLVRVVVLNFNQAEYTIECVKTIFTQDYSSFDVVVVDNASRDEDYAKLQQQLDPRVNLIRNSKNLGFSAGNNVGAGNISGMAMPEFFFFLNSDTVLEDENTLSILVKDMQNSPECAASSPLINTFSSGIDVRQQIQVRRIPNFIDVLVAYSPLLKRLPFLNEIYRHHIYADIIPYESRVYRVETINGAAFIMRQSVYKSINGFDEGTFLYFEELILGEQIKSVKMFCILNAKIIVGHFQGISSGNRGKKINFDMLKYQINSEKYFLKSRKNLSVCESFIYGLIRSLDLFAKKVLKGFN